MFCTNCGKEESANSKFCTGCGSNLREQQNAPLERVSPVLMQNEAPMELPKQEKAKKGKKTVLQIVVGLIIAAIGLGIVVWVNLHKFRAIYNTWRLSKVDYRIRAGIDGSPSVGWDNFNKLFEYQNFGRLISNTAILGAMSAIMTCVLAFVLILCISKMKNAFLKFTAIGIIALPFFLPFMALFNSIINIFSIELLSKPQSARILVVAMDTLRFVWIPVGVGVMACEYLKNNSVKTVLWITGCIAIFKIATLFMFDTGTVLQTYQPTTYETLDIVGTYAYRFGMTMGNAGLSAAVDIVQNVIAIPLAAVGFVGLYFMLKVRKRIAPESQNTKKGAKWYDAFYYIGYLLVAAIPLFIAWNVFSGLLETEAMEKVKSFAEISVSMGNALDPAIKNALHSSVLALVLAYPFFYSKKGYYAGILLVAFVSAGIFGEYWTFREAGFTMDVNLTQAVIITSGFNIIAILSLYFIVSSRYEYGHIPNPWEYLKSAIAPTAIIAAAVFIFTYGSDFLWPMILVRDAPKMPLSVMSQRTLGISWRVFYSSGTEKDAADALLSATSAYISVMPVVVGLIAFSGIGAIKTFVFDRWKKNK